MSALEAIRARAEAATEGPWTALTDPGDRKTAPAWIVDADEVEVRMPATYKAGKVADFIAYARTDVPRLLAALDAIAALHQPIDALMYGGKSQAHKVQVCTGCGQDDGNWNRYPCPTVRAITTALEGTA